MVSSDIDDLWKKALAEYEEETNVKMDPEQSVFRKIRAYWRGDAVNEQPEIPTEQSQQKSPQQKTIVDYIMAESNDFKEARNDEGTAGKIRSALLKIWHPLSLLAKTACNAAETACPAAPVIMLAFTHIVGACTRLREDLDLIEKLFEITHHFVDRLSLLDGKLPDVTLYREHVTRSFCAILAFCTRTHKFIAQPTTSSNASQKTEDGKPGKMHGALSRALKVGKPQSSTPKPRIRRLLEWCKALAREGGDESLKEAYNNVMTCIANLESATIMQTLAFVVDMRSEAKNQDQLVVKSLGGIWDVLAVLEQKVVSREQVLKFHRETAAGLRDLDRSVKSILVKGNSAKVDADPDPVERKSQDLESVAIALTIGAETQMKQRLSILEQSYVEGTFTWIRETDAYKSFMAGQDGLLFVSGASGTGKSMLSYLIYKHLLKDFEHDDLTSIVYFAFDDETQNLQSVQKMLYYCAVQIATKDATYLQEVQDVIQRDTSQDELGEHAWDRLFRERFHEGMERKRNLVMILDGVDQLPDQEQCVLANLLSDAEGSEVTEEQSAPNTKLPIRFILTGSSVLSEQEQEKLVESPQGHEQRLPTSFVLPGVQATPKDTLKGVSILLNRGSIRGDIRRVARSRVKTLPRLSQFPHQLRKKLIRKIDEKADSFIYADHTLRQFNDIGSWSVIIKLEESLPSNTTALYEKLLAECLQLQKKSSQEALKRLFVWLAYSKQGLSLGAAARLLVLGSADPADSGLILEEEIGGRLSRVLTVMEHFDGSDHDTDIGSDDAWSDHAVAADSALSGQVVAAEHEVKSLLGFHERSLRFYVRKALEQATSSNLRLSDHAASVTMFDMTARILTMPPAGDKYSDAEEELISYASASFHEHLLGLKGLNVQEARLATERLLAVLRNTHGALRKLEEITDMAKDDEYYSIFGSPGKGSEGVDQAFEVMKELTKAAELPSVRPPEDGSSQVDELTEDQLGDRAAILKQIARRHIDNWFEADLPSSAYTSFRFAHQALCYLPDADFNELGTSTPDVGFTSGLAKDSHINAELINAVADWGRPTKKALDYQRISLAMFVHSYLNEAIHSVRLGLPLAVSDREKFELSYVIALSKFQLWKDAFKPRDISFEELIEMTTTEYTFDEAEIVPDNDECEGKSRGAEAASAISAAMEIVKLCEDCLALWSEEFESHGALLFDRKVAYEMKARLEVIKEGEETKAIQSMEQAVAVKLPSSLDFTFDYINDLIEALGAREKWGDIIDLLRRLENDNPFTSELWDLTYWNIHRAAKERPADRATVKKLYLDAIPPRLEGTGPEAQGTVLWSARYHYLVLDETATAKEQLWSILKVKLGHSTHWSARASRTLANILTEEFRESRNPEAKAKTMKEMERLDKNLEQRHGTSAKIEQAHTRIPLAIMRRKMGPAKVFCEELRATFKGCLGTLHDDRSDNDPYSFRMLAKALALIPGLEEYAQVALSCQFSILDREQWEKERKEKRKTEGDGDGDDDDSNVDDDDGGSDDEGRNDDEGSSDDEGSNDDKGSNDDNGSDGDSDGSTGSDDDSDGGSDSDSDGDGDEEYWSITCSDCKEKATNFEKGKHWYLCYYCVNTDLCEDCYNAREERYGPGQQTGRVVVCPWGHDHIEGPINDWKGVKNGEIEYGDSKIKVQDWFDKLEREWAEAWEKYWTDEYRHG